VREFVLGERGEGGSQKERWESGVVRCEESGEVRGTWRGARDVARCEGCGDVRGTWRGTRDVARGSGSNDENDTLSSSWQPCVQCIHLFKEHHRFPEVFSLDLRKSVQSVSIHIPPSGRTGVVAVLHGRFRILM